MSDKALALVFLNLGGEMLYVLDQRLYAQKIQVDKGKLIMKDIVSSMFSERFLDEIFKPQEMCSRKAFRTIFEKIAHTSIMRLNESSMDKLYDLMTMAVKYQISLITSPREILLVTLNHLDSVLAFIEDSPSCVLLIESCYKRLIKHFFDMNNAELQLVRHTMLNFFQDLKIKVSVFLKDKVQNWNGTYILYCDGPVVYDGKQPGTITYFDTDDGEEIVVKETKYNPVGKYAPPVEEGSYERNGDRITKYGLNVYSSNKPVDTIVPSERTNNKAANVLSDYETNVPDPRSRAQLDLLCKLIGKSSTSSSSGNKADFKLNLFNNEEEEFIYSTQSKSEIYVDDSKGKLISFDASKRNRDERLDKVVNQFSSSGGASKNKNSKSRSTKQYDEDNDDDDDIVAMMDRLNK